MAYLYNINELQNEKTRKNGNLCLYDKYTTKKCANQDKKDNIDCRIYK